MSRQTKLPSWWDRELDDSQKPIRQDVRQAANSIWSRACTQVYKILGDRTEAPDLFEKAVQDVSLYLDKINEPPTNPGGLLLHAVRRLARRVAWRRDRVRAVGGLTDLPNLPAEWNAAERLDRKIFVEELLEVLRPESQGVLRLRLQGLSWDEIGEMFQVDAAILQKRFWRDVRRAHLRLLREAEERRAEKS
jgi:DNA-directed RNA polymerase specialized sigma24 family protein